MDAPSMVQRSGDTLIIRSVVSGDQIFWSGGADDTDINEQHQQQRHHHRKQLRRHHHLNAIENNNEHCAIDATIVDAGGGGRNNNNNNNSRHSHLDASANATKEDGDLPQCKIKRNYSCNSCSYFTQNPRHFLAHLRDIHGEKIIINECKHCLYASRHYQKLVRHMKMVHGSTEGLEEQAQSRKRASQLARELKKRRQMAAANSSTSGGGGGGVGENANGNDVLPVSMVHMPIIKVKSPEKMQATTTARDVSTTPTGSGGGAASDTATDEFLNNKFLKCSLCDFTTLYRTQIIEHERDEHNKTKFFRCQKCSYVTHIKARFSKHVKYHSMPMIKCIMCDFRTPYKWNLDRHMKNHGGTGPFKCAACNFTADIKQSLTVHEMNHHVPPVGHASGMSLAGPRRRNKVGATDVLSNGENSNDPYEITPTDMMQIELNDQSYPEAPTPTTPKKPMRPLPNLIPIQPLPVSNDAVNLTTRSKIRAIDEAELKESPDVHMKRSQSSVLKDFASLFGGGAGGADDIFDGSETSQLSPVSNASSAKRKNTNFFNELMATGNRDGNNLMCQCGHASKCLSEAIIHKKSCGKSRAAGQCLSPMNLTVQSGRGSTRCQYCRHRCKTSTDLYIHMQSCLEAARSSADSFDSGSEIESNADKIDAGGDMNDEAMATDEPHPMENKVFVWNKMPAQTASASASAAGDANTNSKSNVTVDDLAGPHSEDSENNEDEKADDSTYYGVETAPGYGEVTKKMLPDDEAMSSSLKKVFKCPHCSFWASTASRFHVHIVGHLNRKPFECSLCSYRSNWRWDITKHIRLKTIRDVSHKNAKVLMNDETGRRNYTKYNKYITLMKVTEEDGDPKLLKSGEMTAIQEAHALTFPRRTTTDTSAAMGQQTDANLQLTDDEMIGANAFLFEMTAANNNNNSAQPAQAAADNDSEHRPAEGETAKKVSFKCKKCNYRHTNRDVVLAHVKSHYKENASEKKEEDLTAAASAAAATAQSAIPSLTEISNEYNNNVYGFLSAISLTPTTTNKMLLQPSMLYNPSTQQQQRLAIAAAESKASNAVQSTNKIASQQTTTTNNENGEMDEASSGFTSVNGWRCPAPYRCGHCHQVSNWKHVIQRHCRLKHDGDIRIEMTEKGTRIYQPISIAPTGGTSINASTSSIDAIGGTSMLSASDDHSKNDDIDMADDSEKKAWIIPGTVFLESNNKFTNESDSDLNVNTKSAGVNKTKSIDSTTASTSAAVFRNLRSSGPSERNVTMPNLNPCVTLVKINNHNNERAKQTTVKQIEKIQELRNGSNADATKPTRMRLNQVQNAIDIDMDVDNDDDNDNDDDVANGEKCPHCPFSTNESDVLKEHMMCHICVSGHIDLANCDFCDFSIADESQLIEHNKIHFDLIKNKQKTVAFYTIYDDLELTTVDQQQQQPQQQQESSGNSPNNNNNDERHPNQYATVKKLYPKVDNNSIDLHYSSDKENKILVDINTGHVVMNNY